MERQLIYSSEKRSSFSASEKESTLSHQEWKVGQIVDDKYEIEDVLAQDESKIIHKVRHCQWNIPLVVRSQLQKESRVGFFHQSEQWVALEKHPNIVGAYYLKNIGGIPRLFVEYIKAQTLFDFIHTEKEHDVETILDIAIQICWGMEHTHQKGLLHGDLRSGNIFITDEYQIKVTDFRSREEKITEYSPYMPPEQFEQEFLMRPAMDIYAFGVILYELCLKEFPFKLPNDTGEEGDALPETSIEAFKNIVLTQPPQVPHKVNPKIPEALSQIIVSCLAVNPENRPRRFDEIHRLLKPIYIELTGFRYPREAPNPSNLIAVDLNNRALSLLDLNQEEEAEKYLEQALTADPLCTGALINLQLLKLRKGKTSLEGLRIATEALLAQDHEVVTFYRASISLQHGGFLEESLEEVSRALENSSNNRELLRLKGLLFKRLGRFDQASVVFQELLETEKPAVQDFYELSHCYLNLTKPKSARDTIEEGVKIYPNNNYLRLALGVTSALQGRVEDAHVIFSEKVEKEPDNFWALVNLAEITAAYGQYVKAYAKATPNYDKAQSLYQKLWPRAPWLPRILNGYELAYKSLPDYGDVKRQRKTPHWSYARSLPGHQEGVHCVAISPNSKLVVAGGADENIRIWEITTGRCKKVLAAHNEGTKQICISHDGHFATTIGRENYIRVWDLIVGKSVTSLEGHIREVTCMDLTSTGYLVTGSLDKTLRIWDLGALECRKIMKGHSDKINCLATTSDGSYAVSGSEDKKVGIWSIEQGSCLAILEGHEEGVTCLALSPDNKYAISGSWDQKLRVWDIENKSCLSVLTGHVGTLNCISITADSKWVVSGSEDKTVRVWNIQTGECIHSLEGHSGVVTCLAIASKSRFVVSGSWDHSLRIWSLDTGECLAVLEGHTDLLNTIAITSDEAYIISGGDDEILRVWTDLTTQICPPFEELSLSYLLQRPISRDGNIEGLRRVVKLLNEANEQAQEGNLDKSLKLYREIQNVEGFSRNPRILKAIHSTALSNNFTRKNPRSIWQQQILKKHSGAVLCTAISQDGNIFITGSADNKICVWDLQEGKCIRILKGHSGSVSCLSISPNGRFVISGSRDNSLRLWELSNGSCIYALNGHNHWVEHALFSPDGRRVISGSRDGSVKIWELKTGHRLYTLNGHTDIISILKITDDTHMVSGSHDRSLKVWELESGECLHTLERHRNHVKCIFQLPGTPFFITGGWDGALYLWDIEKGECEKSYYGHQSWINSIAVTSDNKKLVSGSLDSTIRVWDIESGACLNCFDNEKEDVAHIRITSDDLFCVSTSSNRIIRVWSIETGECLKVLEGHEDSITTINLVQESRYLVSGDKSGNIIVWEMDWDWEIAKSKD